MNSPLNDPIQREIWTTVRALNDAWTKGRPDELVNYFHPQMLAITPTDRHRRDGAEQCIAGWKGFVDATHIHRWEEKDALIRVFGDAAVVSYYYEIDFDMGDQHFEQGGRDLLFLVRENGRWWVVADQFSGYPAGS